MNPVDKLVTKLSLLFLIGIMVCGNGTYTTIHWVRKLNDCNEDQEPGYIFASETSATANQHSVRSVCGTSCTTRRSEIRSSHINGLI